MEKKKSKGLGDTIEKITKATGIKKQQIKLVKLQEKSVVAKKENKL